jgi:Ca2+-binding EF-hand superfamily protein
LTSSSSSSNKNIIDEDPILSCAASRIYRHQIGSVSNQIDETGVRRPIVRAKLAKVIFDKYDTDQDGFISRNALLHAIHSYDSMGLPQQAIDTVVESIGICSDGKVNIEEFALILLKLQSRG